MRTVVAQPSPLSVEELRQRMQDLGRERYHHRHPFHLLMHEGRLSRGQLQAWALNRYYYQSRIPIKDAIILSRSEDQDFRRAWRKRVVDHDGDAAHEGGIERWIRLAEATGLEPQRVTSGDEILPATCFAVDAYLDLVKNRTFLEAVASSLTELFSRDLIALRMDAMRKHYPWLSHGLDYFTARLDQAPEDARFAFDYVAEHATTREEQELAIGALSRKCDILWAQLDALHFAYVEPGWPPPGAFIPKKE
jgi:coenzyme PQQ biosynthesis protein C